MRIRLLTYSGAIPFLLAAVATATDQRLPLVSIEPARLAISYGVVIACFMAGAQWGYCQRTPAIAHSNTPLVVVTNAIALLAWGFAILAAPVLALLGLALLFVALWLTDQVFARRGVIEPTYLRLRTQITTLVVACLVVTAYAY